MPPSSEKPAYSCFISWAHESEEHVRKIAGALCKRLDGALGASIQERVFLDLNRGLRPGSKYEPQLAEALCSSYSMIALCGPAYYRSKFCSREWNSMSELARARLGRDHGLVFPVWISAHGAVPEPILRTQRLANISEKVWTLNPNFANDRWFKDLVARVIEPILEAHRKLAPLPTKPCSSFRLSDAAWDHERPETWSFPE